MRGDHKRTKTMNEFTFCLGFLNLVLLLFLVPFVFVLFSTTHFQTTTTTEIHSYKIHVPSYIQDSLTLSPPSCNDRLQDEMGETGKP